jgi:glycosyltransferase involved in cell wall biosynthesis
MSESHPGETSAPIPILLMVQELGQGGSERQMTEIARALDRRRFLPHVGTLRPAGYRTAELEAAGVHVARFELRSFRSAAAVRAAHHMRQYLRHHRIRLVHTFDAPTNVFGIPVARSRPRILAVSSQRAFRELAGGLRPLLRGTDRLAHAVVVNCKALEQHLIQDEAVAPRKIQLCYNGIDLNKFQPAVRTRLAPVQDADVVIGCVCALRPEKNLRSLLRAFALSKARTPRTRLVIVGSGPVLPELRQLAAELAIEANCWFEPSTPDVADWLRSIDIFVLPSSSEALSNSLMEAMACGCCAVATQIGGNPELVLEGRTGLLYPSGDSEALARHLDLLIADAHARNQFAESGTRFIHESFSLAASAHRMAAIYDQLLHATPV